MLTQAVHCSSLSLLEKRSAFRKKKNDGGTMEQGWWKSKTSNGGTVEQRMWDSRSSDGGTVEHLMVEQWKI